MTTSEVIVEDDLSKFCIPIGTAVSAKFRGAFCEALVNSVDKIILCRIQLVDNKKTLKINAEDIIGNISTNSKVQVKIPQGLSNGIILKVIDNSIYHVVFNDGDTGKLRRNQLVLKGDRHYKESESLDQHPLTNPEHFTKAVVYEKRSKDKSDIEDDEYDNDDQKSCSQESLTTVSSNKTRRQQTHASSPSVGTVGSNLTVRTDELNKSQVTKISKYKKHANTKYLIGCMVIVSRIVRKLASSLNEKLNKKNKTFVGLIVSPSSCDEEINPDIKSTQCVIKSFLDNSWYIVFKRDLEIVVKREMLIKHKESDLATNVYVERCLLFFDVKIFPEFWDSSKLLYLQNHSVTDEHDRSNTKSTKKTSSLTNSMSSMDSSSSDDGNDKSNKSNSSDQEYQNTKDEWVARFYGFWEDKGSPVNQGLEIQGTEVDIYKLFELVKEFGGFQKANTSVRWPHIYHLLKLPQSSSENYQRLQILYKKFIYPYVEMKKKLGTFEQSRIRKQNEKSSSVSQKARPLLSARVRREYVRQSGRKTAEARSVSSQSVCERPIDHGVSGDEIGTNSLIEEASQLSQCSSSPKPVFDRTIIEGDQESKSNVTVPVNRLSPGTIISVAYGDKKVYKAKIIQQHSPENKAMKSPSIDSKNIVKVPRTSLDSLSNADSASSVNNDFKSEIDSSTFYKVHYIGWNSRHDEIISPERILEVISDAGMDNQSTCSSSCRQKPTVSDTEQAPETVHNNFSDSCNISDELIIDESVPVQIECDHVEETVIIEENVIESESIVEVAEKEQEVVQKENQNISPKKPVNNLKRQRSRSACVPEFDLNPLKKFPKLIESRIIESLNLYKIGDKMPLPPKRTKHEEIVEIDEKVFHEECKKETKIGSPSFEFQSDSPSKRDSVDMKSVEMSIEQQKDVPIEIENSYSKNFYFKQENRIRSPSFSNDSISDASTLSFRNEQDQSVFYLSPNEEAEKSPHVAAVQPKIGNKRGRKPLFRPDRKTSVNNMLTKIRDNRSDIIEIESTSSQHSGSQHGRRVTRSIRTASEQNTVDDNSMHNEDDSQTSQDDNAFQLPTGVPIDNIRTATMIPLATGTPTLHSQKGRRPKSRRKNRNSLSTSSADGTYQDSNGETTSATATTTISVIIPNTDPQSIINFDNNNINFISNNIHRPSGRLFQRLHPSLIPTGLEKLPPEERVKLLEKVIRQTHLNFLDVKDKLKYVERQILEIRAGRANGHGIESDEDKFR